ncbi:hypothetical protein GGD66_002315 [Bradyrhizobium sp. CIR48]|uniref:hypothetical protein n=1 Tax=Bradyrhizobium sp. CIR48 TaxID=2663840 RepID=UPI0016060C3F|nr:hypothetical protein [Bradyrhizobium sp. CIR48]MBB4423771.1 hypothetical protein [Bradyrhizobium sp. CIR48]
MKVLAKPGSSVIDHTGRLRFGCRRISVTLMREPPRARGKKPDWLDEARRGEVKSRGALHWADRMARLAVHAPDLNIFSANFVFRDALGWEIAQDGRQSLSATAKAVAGQREALINHLFLVSGSR